MTDDEGELEALRAYQERLERVRACQPSREELALVWIHAHACLARDFRFNPEQATRLLGDRVSFEEARDSVRGPTRFLLETVAGRLPPEAESPALHAAVAKLRAFVTALEGLGGALP